MPPPPSSLCARGAASNADPQCPTPLGVRAARPLLPPSWASAGVASAPSSSWNGHVGSMGVGEPEEKMVFSAGH